MGDSSDCGKVVEVLMITSSSGPGLLFPKVFPIVYKNHHYISLLLFFLDLSFRSHCILVNREGGRMMRQLGRLQLEKLSKKLEFAGFYWSEQPFFIHNLFVCPSMDV